MNEYSSEVWKHAPAILEKLEGMWKKGSANFSDEMREAVTVELLALLYPPGEAEDAKPDAKAGVEDFEYALQTALMKRLESGKENSMVEAIHMIDVTAAVVIQVFQRASKPSAPASDTDRCKAWWTMFFTVAEDVSRLIPATHIDQLVGRWEDNLVKLRAAYLQLATVRLAEVDTKAAEREKAAEETAEAEKAEKDKEGGDKDAKEKEAKPKDEGKSKEAKEKEAASRRFEERKKMISQLWISPNGQLYLTMTSLLKQLSARLVGSTQAAVRARIVILLEQLLAMDHKAIANNQKSKNQDFIKEDDMDSTEHATSILTTVAAEKPEGGKDEAVTLALDPEVDAAFYKKFWGLQDALQFPEKVIEKAENWKSFQQGLAQVLKLFEKYPVKDARQEPWTEPQAFPVRVAPRADAFRMQLGDAAFRQQFLTQILIAFQALEQDATSKMGLHEGPMVRKGGSDSMKREFQGLKTSAEACLEATRPGFPKMLKHVLAREAHWLLWKGYGCREFERESLEMLSAKPNPGDVLDENPVRDPPVKPKLAGHINSMLKTLMNPQWEVSKTTSTSTSEEAAAQMQGAKSAKMCDSKMDRLIEDEKPENGIEDEYKAKKNKVFMWQSRRLFCQQYLHVYAAKENQGKTDFINFVRMIKGVPEDGAAALADGAVAEGSPPADAEADAEPEADAEAAGEKEDSAMPADSPTEAATDNAPKSSLDEALPDDGPDDSEATKREADGDAGEQEGSPAKKVQKIE